MLIPVCPFISIRCFLRIESLFRKSYILVTHVNLEGFVVGTFVLCLDLALGPLSVSLILSQIERKLGSIGPARRNANWNPPSEVMQGVLQERL